MSAQPPGPICGTQLGGSWIDNGTSCLTRTGTPGPVGLSGPQMSATDKIAEAMRRSLPMLPGEARQMVEALLTPESLAIVVATLVAWAGSHLIGVGEIVDIILLVVGVAALGLSVFNGADELYRFATTALNAQSGADLDRAARHFAAAVNILGISVISALLLRSSARAVIKRGSPQVHPLPNVGKPPPAGLKPRITRPASLPSGALGETDWWGNIAVTRNQVLTEQRLTLFHEWVHSVLSPKVGPLRQLRAQLRASGYWRSALLRYLEEALAESYAQLRVHGFQQLLTGIRFPISGGYVTVSQIAAEGIAIGNISIGTVQFTVSVEEIDWEALVK